YSEQTAQTIDREVRDIVERNYRRAVDILTKQLSALHSLAQALLEYETLDGSEVESIIRGEKITRKPVRTGGTPPGTAAPVGSGRPTEPEGGPTPDPVPA